MRRALSLVVATAIVTGLALVAAVPAGASVEAGGKKQSKYCKAVGKFDTGDIGNPTSESGAAKTAKQLKKLQKSARGDTKDAIGELVEFYERVADGEKPTKVFLDGDFISASGTFAASAIKCLGENLPDITLPDIDLPDLTLPDLSGN